MEQLYKSDIIYRKQLRSQKAIRPTSKANIEEMLFHILKRFGKAAIAVELTAVGGLFYVFHDINTGGPEARSKWDDRMPFLIDAFYNMTGDERVIAHRINRSRNDDN